MRRRSLVLALALVVHGVDSEANDLPPGEDGGPWFTPVPRTTPVRPSLKILDLPIGARLQFRNFRTRPEFTHHNDELVILTGAERPKLLLSKRRNLEVRDARQTDRETDVELAPGAQIRTEIESGQLAIDVFPAAQPTPANSGTGVAAAGSSQAAGAAGAASRSGPDAGPLIAGLPAPFIASIVGERPADPPGRQADIVPANAARATDDPSKRRANGDSPPRTEGTTTSVEPELGALSGPVRSVVFPFSDHTGLAVRRRADSVDLVFDERRPIDLARFRDDPVFGHAQLVLLPRATVIRLPLPPRTRVSTSPVEGGWKIALSGTEVPVAATEIVAQAGGLTMLVPMPSQSMVIDDPDDGGVLLVGTSRSSDGSTLEARRSALFSLATSDRGVFVRPLADDLELIETTTGFRLMSERRTDLHKPAATATAPTDLQSSRSFHFPQLPVALLVAALHDDMRHAASRPVRGRLPSRLDLAETQISLGLGREADAVLDVASRDDPSFALDPRAEGLRTIARLIAGEPAQDDLNCAAQAGSDEARLWSILAAGAATPEARGIQAAFLCAHSDLIESYPAPLRAIARRLAAARSAPTSGRATGSCVLSDPAGQSVAAAVALDRSGHPAEARARLAELGNSRDLGTMAAALLARTRIDVRDARMTPAEAATLISAHTLDWRVTDTTAEALVDGARYSTQAGLYRDAIRQWQDVRELTGIGDDADRRIGELLDRVADPRLTPTVSTPDLIAILSENGRRIAERPDTQKRLDQMLVDRLDSMDLPLNAGDALARILPGMPPGPSKAALGLRLVRLRLQADDAAGARAVFDALPELPAGSPLIPMRQVELARLREREGRPAAEILSSLDGVTGEEADRLRAHELEIGHRWHDAKLTLASLVRTFPAHGQLTGDQAGLAVDLASVALRDGDAPLVRELYRDFGDRVPASTARSDLQMLAASL